MDDVINISGHRLGTAEIEDAMVSSKQVEVSSQDISVEQGGPFKEADELKQAQGLLPSDPYPCIHIA